MRRRLGLPKIPKEERWLYDDPVALGAVMRGLEDIKEGRISRIDAEIPEEIDIDAWAVETNDGLPDINDDLIPDF